MNSNIKLLISKILMNNQVRTIIIKTTLLKLNYKDNKVDKDIG